MSNYATLFRRISASKCGAAQIVDGFVVMAYCNRHHAAHLGTWSQPAIREPGLSRR